MAKNRFDASGRRVKRRDVLQLIGAGGAALAVASAGRGRWSAAAAEPDFATLSAKSFYVEPSADFAGQEVDHRLQQRVGDQHLAHCPARGDRVGRRAVPQRRAADHRCQRLAGQAGGRPRGPARQGLARSDHRRRDDRRGQSDPRARPAGQDSGDHRRPAGHQRQVHDLRHEQQQRDGHQLSVVPVRRPAQGLG